MDKRVVFAVVAVVAMGLSIAYFFMNKDTGFEYACADGSIVSNLDDCPTTTNVVVTTSMEETTTIAFTMASTKATKATTTTFACVFDSDCSLPRNLSAYCDGSYVKYDIYKPVCIEPKSPASRCGITPTGETNVLQQCKTNFEFCQRGMCVPRSCVNGRRDFNEVMIDCGGNCPQPCDEFSVICANDSDCTEMRCDRDYFCLETNPAYNCTFGSCVNRGTNLSLCVNETSTFVNDVCGRGKHCTDGRGVCLEGGTCTDCVRNQDEMDIDCGGVACKPCAVLPESFDVVVLSPANGSKADYLDQYGNTYLFTLDRIYIPDVCPSGAYIHIDYHGTVIASTPYPEKPIGRHSDVMMNKFNVGLLNVTFNSATLWVRELKLTG
ncbi:MAG: hypothetical protein PHG85_03610 [Candidatus Altiarchaeota archaeon]|nr:hypothetical protein [Candidatus Altiarchaeota archaeon]